MHEDAVSKPIPTNAYVIIIGAMKAGTTSLFQLLAQHPEICPSGLKEPEFFSRQFGYPLDTGTYEDLFEFDPAVHLRCLEASTGYTKFPYEEGVPERMRRYGIEPRFIYAVRNPFERLESEYNFGHFHKRPWRYRALMNAPSILYSMYYLQLREFLRWYPDMDRYFIVDFDEIANDPSGLALKLFKWIGVSPFDIAPAEASNVTPSISTAEKFLQESPIAWKRFLPDGLRNSVKAALRRGTPSVKKRLSEKQRAELKEYLQLDMQRFAETFDFPIEKWGFSRDADIGKRGRVAVPQASTIYT